MTDTRTPVPATGPAPGRSDRRRRPSLMGVAATAAALLAACSPAARQPAEPPRGAQSDSARPTTSATSPQQAEPATADAVIRAVSRTQWNRMVAAGMWRVGCPVRRADLRRVEVNHRDFSGNVRRGVLVVNADVAASVARIFTRLFDEGFPIRRMQPLEAYGGDNTASLAADNTGAYNCRRPDQINAPPMQSPHANGRAIDINPRENPWKDLRCRCWSPSPRHSDRTPGPGKILKGGVVWRAFTDEGWVWQDIKVPDYMHFDTGYPSRPFRQRASSE